MVQWKSSWDGRDLDRFHICLVSVGLKQGRGDAPHEGPVPRTALTGPRRPGIGRLLEAGDADCRGAADVAGPLTAHPVGPAAVVPVNHVVRSNLDHISCLGRLGPPHLLNLVIREQDGAGQVRVVGCVPRGPVKVASADDLPQAVGVPVPDALPWLELQGGAKRVAGVDAEQRAKNPVVGGGGRRVRHDG